MVAKTYTRKACEGNIRIVVNRDGNNKFCSIQIYPPAKNSNCGYSWAFAVQDLLTFCLKRAGGQREVNLITKSVAGHFCNACPPSETRHRSCVDAISQILKKEFVNVSSS